MKRAIFLILGAFALSAAVMLTADVLAQDTGEITLRAVLNRPYSATMRAKHATIGNTYSSTSVMPDSAFTDDPDIDMVIEGNVGILYKYPRVKLQVAGEVLLGPRMDVASTGLPFSFGGGKNVLWLNSYDYTTPTASYDYGVIYGELIYAGTVFRLNVLSGDNREGSSTENDEIFIGNVDSTTGTKSGMIIRSGMVGIGTETPSQYLTVYNGTTTGTYTTAGWTHTSDARLKADIGRIDNALDKIMAIDGVYFNWKNDPGAGRQIGFIAQDLMKVLPEAVMKNNDGYYTTTYDEVIPVLVNASKELKEGDDSLEARIAALEARIAK